MLAENKLEEAMIQIQKKDIEILKSGSDKKDFNELFNDLQHKNNLNLIDSTFFDKIKNVISIIEEKGLLKGKGGEIMRFSVNHFIYWTSLAKVQYSDEYLKNFIRVLEENAVHSKIEIQLSAVNSFNQLWLSYFNEDVDVNQNKRYVITNVTKLAERSVKDPNIDVTRGWNMILGNLSRSIIKIVQNSLLKTVLSNMIPKDKPNDDAETRKYAVRSQIDMIVTLGLDSIEPSLIKESIEYMYRALDDYALDKRGDVGSWVREEAMRSLNMFIYELFFKWSKDLLDEIIPENERNDFFIKYIGSILQQLMEKIDKIRQVAGQILQSFFTTFPTNLFDFEEKDLLMVIFVYSEEGVEENTLDSAYLDTRGYLNAKFKYKPWRNPSFVFSQVSQLIESKNFSKSILTGIVSSSGGLTESTLKSSLDVLIKYLFNLKGSNNEIQQKSHFMKIFNQIFYDNIKVERITVPLMKTLESLLRTTYLSHSELNDDFIKLHENCVKEVSKKLPFISFIIHYIDLTKNIPKLITWSGILGEMLSLPGVKDKALRSLLLMLFNAFPKVRKLVSESLYNYLLTLEDPTSMFESEEQYDEAIVMLSETDWGMKLKDLSSTYKDSIFKIFGQEPPKKKTSQNENDQEND